MRFPESGFCYLGYRTWLESLPSLEIVPSACFNFGVISGNAQFAWLPFLPKHIYNVRCRFNCFRLYRRVPSRLQIIARDPVEVVIRIHEFGLHILQNKSSQCMIQLESGFSMPADHLCQSPPTNSFPRDSLHGDSAVPSWSPCCTFLGVSTSVFRIENSTESTALRSAIAYTQCFRFYRPQTANTLANKMQSTLETVCVVQLDCELFPSQIYKMSWTCSRRSSRIQSPEPSSLKPALFRMSTSKETDLTASSVSSFASLK